MTSCGTVNLLCLGIRSPENLWRSATGNSFAKLLDNSLTVPFKAMDRKSIYDSNKQGLHPLGDRSIRFSSMISQLPLPETRSSLLMLTGRGFAGNILCVMYNLRDAVLLIMFQKSLLTSRK